MYSDIFEKFTAIGFADGYADIEENTERIINELKGIYDKSTLIECISYYLSGYEVGKFMSENATEIYDEDGFFKEDEYAINADIVYNREIAKELIRKNY